MTSWLLPVSALLRSGLHTLRRVAPAVVLASVAALSTACVSFDQQTNLLTPSGSAATTTAPPVDGSSSGSMVGVWASDDGFSVADVSTCAGFEWDISSQSPTVVYGSFAATCGGSLRITGTGNGTTVSANQVAITVNGAATIGGFAACSFSVNGVGTVMNSDRLVIPYEGTTCLGPVRGTETLRRKTSTPPAGPPEPPAPPPPPPPPPTPTNPAPGGFDLGGVTIVGSPDVRGWPITSRLTSLRFGGGQIHLDHTRRGTWPPVVIANDGTTQESTLWVFFNVNGKWYGTGGERWRPGQTDKALSKPSDIGPGWLYDQSRWGPMANYVPRPGELVGFMVAAGSTRSDANINVAERSQVVLINFPSDNGGAFPPFAWEEN